MQNVNLITDADGNAAKHYKGDTFKGKAFQILINSVAKNLTSTAIRIEFRKQKKTGELLHAITEGSGITITNAAQGRFEIDKFVMDFPVGVIYWDCQLTDPGTPPDINTYIGGSFEVEQDVTKPAS